MTYTLKKQRNILGTYVMYDLQRNPQKVSPRDTGDAYVFEAVLPRAVFYTQLMVEGFGGAMVFADNRGEGYQPSDTALDMWREGCESRLHRVRRYAQRVQGEWGYLPKAALQRLETARALLDTGDEADVERALCQVLWAGEALVLFQSDNRIAKRGKRDSFTFGCCLKGFTDGGEDFKRHFLELFGHGTIPTHWGCFEPHEGETHYDVMFDMLDWANTNGVAVRGHALVWFCPWWEKENWMGKLDFEAIRRLEVERARLIFSRRPNAFESVDFNEPLQQNPYNFTMEQHFRIVKDVYDVVRELSPNTRIMINFYDEWQNKYGMDVNGNTDYMEFRRQYKLPPSPPNEYCCTIRQFLDHCAANDLKVDLLGLQLHDFPYDLFNTMELLEMWHDRYGLPIQITEACTPSGMGRAPIRMGLRPAPATPYYWHKPWTQQVQAQWYRDFARLFYALDYVEVFNVWSYSDAPTQWADYLEGHINEKFKLGAFAFDGMMDYDSRPKLLYHQLRELVEKWKIK